MVRKDGQKGKAGCGGAFLPREKQSRGMGHRPKSCVGKPSDSVLETVDLSRTSFRRSIYHLQQMSAFTAAFLFLDRADNVEVEGDVPRQVDAP